MDGGDPNPTRESPLPLGLSEWDFNLAGILILVTKLFRVGDQIIFKHYEGTVEDIQTRATYMRSYDGRRIIIPNGELFTNSVTVNTTFPKRRWQFDIGIGYGDDVERAREIILRVPERIQGDDRSGRHLSVARRAAVSTRVTGDRMAPFGEPACGCRAMRPRHRSQSRSKTDRRRVNGGRWFDGPSFATNLSGSIGGSRCHKVTMQRHREVRVRGRLDDTRL